jgi:hypothetical protein
MNVYWFCFAGVGGQRDGFREEAQRLIDTVEGG